MEYTLEKLEVYNLSENFSDEIWDKEVCESLIELCKKMFLKLNAFIKFVRNSQTNKPIN